MLLLNNHLFLKEIEEFLGNPTRLICFFSSDGALKLHLGSNSTERFARDKKFWKKKQCFGRSRKSN